MKQEFKVKGNEFPIKNKHYALIIGLMTLSIIIGSAIKTKGFTIKLDSLIMVVPIVVGIFFIVFIISMKISKKQFESLEIILKEKEITRKQFLRKDLSMLYNDIEKIMKNNKGTLIIKGKSNLPEKIIFIHKQIEDFDKLEKLLFEKTKIK